MSVPSSGDFTHAISLATTYQNQVENRRNGNYAGRMRSNRTCDNFSCTEPAVASLTYNYTEATAVIGPLPPQKHAGVTEFCEAHANSFNAPQGWQVVRLTFSTEPASPSETDLAALAQAIRDAASQARTKKDLQAGLENRLSPQIPLPRNPNLREM